MKKAKIKGVPHRKISETFLDFAAPLLKDLPGDAPEIPARNALIVCFTAWNAVIFSDVLKDDYFVEEVHRLTAGKPEAALLLELMMSRKRVLFAEDVRLIGNWEVTRTLEGINLQRRSDRSTLREEKSTGPELGSSFEWLVARRAGTLDTGIAEGREFGVIGVTMESGRTFGSRSSGWAWPERKAG